ncbi:MAG: fibronectin type III domain-containing protein [Ruminococcus sp.]|nr:fibronectin type III domain-containing protein [Ruminococcus sp.]
MDIARKRKILKKLKDKGRSNWLLFLPCAIAAFFVRLFYGIALRVDMILPARRVKPEKATKPEKSPARTPAATPVVMYSQDVPPEKKIKPSKRPTYARLISAMLSVCFVFTFLPVAGIGIAAASDNPADYSITSARVNDTQDGKFDNYYYVLNTQKPTAASQQITIKSKTEDYGNDSVLLKINMGAISDPTDRKNIISKVVVEITNNYDTSFKDTSWVFNAGEGDKELFITGLPNYNNQAQITWSFKLVPYYRLPTYYRILPKAEERDGDGNITQAAVAEGFQESTDTFEYPGDDRSINFPRLFVNLDTPARISSRYDTATNTATVSWTKVPDANGYVLTRLNETGTVITTIPIKDGDVNSYEDTDLTSTSVYTYWVEAYKGIADYKDIDYVSANDKYYIFSNRFDRTKKEIEGQENVDSKIITHISPPTGGRYTTSGNSVTVSWQASDRISAAPNPAGYIVYRMTEAQYASAGGTGITLDGIKEYGLRLYSPDSTTDSRYPFRQTSYTDVGVDLSSAIYYAVTSYRNVPVSYEDDTIHESNPLIIRVTSVPQLPAPANVTAMPASDDSNAVFVNASPVTSAASYVISYSVMTNGSPSETSTEFKASSLPAKVRGLRPGTEYRFSVTAVDAGNNYGVASLTTADAIPGTLPSSVNTAPDVTLDTVTKKPVIRIRALASPDYVDKYEIYRRTYDANGTPTTEFVKIDEVPGSPSNSEYTYIDETAANGTTYRYKYIPKKAVTDGVLSGNAFVPKEPVRVPESPQSPTVTVPAPVVPPTPAKPSLGAIDAPTYAYSTDKTQMTLTWKAPANASAADADVKYTIHAYIDGSSDPVRTVTSTKNTTATFATPTDGNVWNFYVVAEDINGNYSQIKSKEMYFDPTAIPPEPLKPSLGGTTTKIPDPNSYVNTDSGRMIVDWQEPVNASAPTADVVYNIYISTTNAPGSFVRIKETISPSVDIDISAYHTGETLYYYIEAVDKNNNYTSVKTGVMTYPAPVTPGPDKPALGLQMPAPLYTYNSDKTIMTMTWQAPTNASAVDSDVKYTVYAYVDGSTDAHKIVTTSYSPSAAFATPTDGNNWCFYVVAEDMNNNYSSVKSKIMFFSPTATPPTSAQPSLGGTETRIPDPVSTVNNGKIVVEWKEPANAGASDANTIYNVYVSTTNAPGSYEKAKETISPVTEINLKQYAPNGETLYYYIEAVDRNGVYSAVKSAVMRYTPAATGSDTTDENGNPLFLMKPRDIAVVPAVNSAQVNWSAVTGAQGYIVYASGPSGQIERNVTSPGFKHDYLGGGDVWSYYVVAYAVNAAGVTKYSAPSDTVRTTILAAETTAATTTTTATTKDTTSTLPAPLDFKVVTTDGIATLTWKTVADAYSYTVRATSRNQNLEFNTSTGSFTHNNLLNGEVWTYTVNANRLGQNGATSAGRSSESITVTIGMTLAQPQDLAATNGNRQVDVSWLEVDGAEGYIIYLYNNAEIQFEPLAVTSEPLYIHTNLVNGTRYTYMVAAYKYINNKQTLSPYSMTVVGVPTTGSPTDLDRIIEIKGALPYGMDHSELASAFANHGAYDKDVDIYISSGSESTNAVRNTLSGYANGIESFIAYPFDIKVYYDESRVEAVPAPGFGVTFTLPIPDQLAKYRDYINVLHINDANQMEILPSTLTEIDGAWTISFIGTSFSPYAFVIYKDQITDASSGTFADLAAAGADTFNFGGLLGFTAMFTKPTPTIRSSSKRRVYRVKAIKR